MKVTDITVRFMRRVQKVQFEPQEAEVTLTASLDEDGNENHIIVANNLMQDAKVVVLKTGHGAVSAAPASEPASVKEAKDKAVKAAVEAAAPAADAADPTDPSAPPAAAAPAAAAGAKNKGGRPKKAAAPAAADPSDPAGAPAPTAAAADPADAPPAADEFDEFSGLEEQAPAPAAVISVKDLQEWITAQISSKRIDVATVKGILSKFGANRSADTKEADRPTIKAQIEAALTAKK